MTSVKKNATEVYLYFSYSFISDKSCPSSPPPSFAKLALNPREDPQGLWPDPEIFNISRAAKSRSSAQFARRSANERKSVTRILTHENLLTSVPTQNVDSAELTDIKRILNVLLKKKKKEVTCMKYVLAV